MYRSKSIARRGWSKEEREFCVEQYYFNRASFAAVKRCYWEKFRDRNGLKRDKCPTSDQLRAWVIHEEKKRASSLMQPHPEEPQKSESEQVLQEKFEEKILELKESLYARGHAARASAFVSLRTELQRQTLDGLLTAHRATLADHVSRALRRGKDGERKAAAAVAPLLAVQIGDEGSEEFVSEVWPALTTTAIDKAASLDIRIEHLQNRAACKARNFTRNKNRDKLSAALTI